MSRPNRSFEKKPSQRRTRADRDARAAARPKLEVDNSPASSSCGECLFDRVEVVALVDGVCPKCGADYRSAP